MNYKNLTYAIACLSFSSIFGAAVYEHTTLWPAAFSEIPKSLTVFQGAYKLNSGAFWTMIHPVTLLLLTIALIANWKTDRKKSLLIPIVGYVLILLATFAFFVPELLDLINTPYNETIDAERTSRGMRWVILSLIRTGFLFFLTMTLLLGLTKSEASKVNEKGN